MADITAGLVSELRGRTSVGMMDCKKALVECCGDRGIDQDGAVGLAPSHSFEPGVRDSEPVDSV